MLDVRYSDSVPFPPFLINESKRNRKEEITKREREEKGQTNQQKKKAEAVNRSSSVMSSE